MIYVKQYKLNIIISCINKQVPERRAIRDSIFEITNSQLKFNKYDSPQRKVLCVRDVLS